MVTRRILSELRQADAILARHFGPTHPIRKDLARIIGNIREKLETRVK